MNRGKVQCSEWSEKFRQNSGKRDSGKRQCSSELTLTVRLIEAARASQDRLELGRLLGEIQGALHRDQPFTFLWEPQQLNGVSRRLRGVQPNPLSSLFRVEEWWLSPAG